MASKVAELSYLAGIVDGEGCICIKKSKNKYGVELSIGMSDDLPWSLCDEFKAGKKSYRRPQKSNWKGTHFWVVKRGSGLEKLLEDLMPYLRVKKQQAVVALQFLAVYGNHCRRDGEVSDPVEADRLWAEMRHLNQKGV